jgi:hypothetical protein
MAAQVRHWLIWSHLHCSGLLSFSARIGTDCLLNFADDSYQRCCPHGESWTVLESRRSTQSLLSTR